MHEIIIRLLQQMSSPWRRSTRTQYVAHDAIRHLHSCLFIAAETRADPAPPEVREQVFVLSNGAPHLPERNAFRWTADAVHDKWRNAPLEAQGVLTRSVGWAGQLLGQALYTAWIFLVASRQDAEERDCNGRSGFRTIPTEAFL